MLQLITIVEKTFKRERLRKLKRRLAEAQERSRFLRRTYEGQIVSPTLVSHLADLSAKEAGLVAEIEDLEEDLS